MFDSLYSSGWGAFAMLLFFQIPFLIIYLFVIYRKSVVDMGPSGTSTRLLSRLEVKYIAGLIVLFLVVNIAAIKYMPFTTVQASAKSEQAIQHVDVTGRMWSWQISERKFEVGRPVQFTVTSADTVHGFAVYHPDGRQLFTMMVFPGMKPSLIHTFTEPGTYKVRCLEYCGTGHHLMHDELIVTKSSG